MAKVNWGSEVYELKDVLHYYFLDGADAFEGTKGMVGKLYELNVKLCEAVEELQERCAALEDGDLACSSQEDEDGGTDRYKEHGLNRDDVNRTACGIGLFGSSDPFDRDLLRLTRGGAVEIKVEPYSHRLSGPKACKNCLRVLIAQNRSEDA